MVIAATLNQFNIPEAGLLLIMGVDQFLDMGRSATNAVGNSIASAVVAKWEGQLSSESTLGDRGEGSEGGVDEGGGPPLHKPGTAQA
ncbi:Proton/sodium-glutamate symport protein [compost metagenome]